MSDIPFVNQLGEAFEAAVTPAARRASTRRRLPRRLAISLAALLALGGGAAAAGVFDSPTKLATNGIACYETADVNGNVMVGPAGDRTPTQACAQMRRSVGQPDVPLVACDNGRGAVAVFPASGPDACKAAGLQTLSPSFDAAQARVRTLGRALLALESRADCIAPVKLGAQVQALLARTGWTGWGVTVRPYRSLGPCGTVSSFGGDGVRTIGGALDSDHRVVIVFRGAYRSTQDLLYSSHGVAGALEDDSGDRCYTAATIRDYAEARLAATGRAVGFVTAPPPVNSQFIGPRQGRVDAGCAVVSDVTPAADGRGLVVHVTQRG